MPLFFLIGILGACSSDENADSASETSISYQASSVSCDGTPTPISGVVFRLTFSSSNTLVLGGVSGDASASCAGSYALTQTTFADNAFTFTRSSAATVCTNIDAEPLTSCDTNGIACDTTATDPAITIAGTYTDTSTQRVLTYTASGNSFCSNGEEEVLTLTLQE